MGACELSISWDGKQRTIITGSYEVKKQFSDHVTPPASIKQRRSVSQLTLFLLHSASARNTSSCYIDMLMSCHCMHIKLVSLKKTYV